MNIPDFKNTEEALSFGKKYQGNKDIINQLKIRYDLIRAKAKELMQENKPNEACFLISGQGQFAREAFEEAEQFYISTTFSNIFNYILIIFNFILKILLWIFTGIFSLIMFLSMLICGIMGFGVFLLFMAFMLYACGIALLL